MLTLYEQRTLEFHTFGGNVPSKLQTQCELTFRRGNKKERQRVATVTTKPIFELIISLTAIDEITNVPIHNSSFRTNSLIYQSHRGITTKSYCTIMISQRRAGNISLIHCAYEIAKKGEKDDQEGLLLQC